MIRRRKATLLLAVLLALALAAAVVPASASSPTEVTAAAAAEEAQQIVVAPGERATYAMPTPDQIANATPMPWPEPGPIVKDGWRVASDRISRQSVPGAFGTATLRQEFWEANADQARAPVVGAPLDVSAYAADGGSTYAINRIYAYPPPYTSYMTNWRTMWWDYPWRTIGKLLFQVPGESGYFSCSASVVHRRLVVTAGHCVYTPGSGWHYSMAFAPAYRNGYAPYGWWNVTNRASLGGWVNSGNQAYDIGMLAMQPSGGSHIGQVVGWLGYSWGGWTQEFWHANGYPGEFAGGEILMVCEGSLSARWVLTGTDPVGMGCNMRWGSSGGPWIRAFYPYQSGAMNYVNSVVSGSPNPDNNNEFFGPYFGQGAYNLYNWGTTNYP
jgi:V8-like Glu-specific endopeptidase